MEPVQRFFQPQSTPGSCLFNAKTQRREETNRRFSLRLGDFALNHHWHANSSVAEKARLIKGGAMKLRVVVEYDPKAGRFSAVLPELPDCASAGDTEALANANETFALWFGKIL